MSFRERRREILQYPRNGGRACDADGFDADRGQLHQVADCVYPDDAARGYKGAECDERCRMSAWIAEADCSEILAAASAACSAAASRLRCPTLAQAARES